MRHAPPPVQYPVDRPVAGAVPAALAGLACASAWVAWALLAPVADLRLLVGAIAVVLAIAWVAADWWTAPRGWLAWNGVHWHWRDRAGPPTRSAARRTTRQPFIGCDVRPVLHLDLQAVMLVRLRSGEPAAGDAPPRWLWLERRQSPATWADLRRAVLHAARSPATVVAPDGGAGTGAERAGS